MNKLLFVVLGNTLSVCWFLSMNVDFLWAAVLILWLNGLFYGLMQPVRRVYYLVFWLAIFVFLLGRETMISVFGYGMTVTDPEARRHLAMVLMLGMGGILIGYVLAGRFAARRRERKPALQSTEKTIDAARLRSAALLVFWLTAPFVMYTVGQQISVVSSTGYADWYRQDIREATATGLAAWVSQLSLVNAVAFCAYLATLPAARHAIAPIIAWFGMLLLTLATGQREVFMVGAAALLCYAVARSRLTPDEVWITRGRLLLVVGLTPFLAWLMARVESWRGVGESYGGSPLQTIADLLYNQGVTATVIMNGYTVKDSIPDQIYLLEFAHSGILARLFDTPVIHGNSLERAEQGGSFTHALASVVLGEHLYLSGRGSGSSFLAEAFQDLGYSGVLVVAVVYGLLLAFVEGLSRDQVFLNALRLFIVQDLFWAARGSATGFLTSLLAPSTLLALMVIALLGSGVRRRSQPSVCGPSARAREERSYSA